MKSFRSKVLGHMAARQQPVAGPTPGAPPPPPPAPKPSRHQRRANAALSRQINEKLKKANALGRSVSLRPDGSGRLKVVMGKPIPKDPGPQPGEVIKSVDGNVLPDFPQPPAEHVHNENCAHDEEDIFAKADKLVEETLGDGP